MALKVLRVILLLINSKWVKFKVNKNSRHNYTYIAITIKKDIKVVQKVLM